MVPILANCKDLVKFSSPTLKFSLILTENSKSIRMYCHTILFHTTHWPNKYILIPSFNLNANPRHNIKAPAVGKEHSTVVLLDNDK